VLVVFFLVGFLLTYIGIFHPYASGYSAQSIDVNDTSPSEPRLMDKALTIIYYLYTAVVLRIPVSLVLGRMHSFSYIACRPVNNLK
jgi:hypothetical protein